MFPKFSVRVRRIWCSCFFFMQLRNAPLLFTENQTHACNDSLNRLRHKLQVFADWFKEFSPLTRKFLSKASWYHLIIFVASTEQRRTLIIKNDIVTVYISMYLVSVHLVPYLEALCLWNRRTWRCANFTQRDGTVLTVRWQCSPLHNLVALIFTVCTVSYVAAVCTCCITTTNVFPLTAMLNFIHRQKNDTHYVHRVQGY